MLAAAVCLHLVPVVVVVVVLEACLDGSVWNIFMNIGIMNWRVFTVTKSQIATEISETAVVMLALIPRRTLHYLCTRRGEWTKLW